MKSEFYKFKRDENALFFEFQSVSKEKTINKVIAYTSFEHQPDIFNLALGDILESGEVSDMTISNNSDLEKIIATVVQTIFLFFEKYPKNFVYFKGSTDIRTRLYRIVIARELEEANQFFKIYGISNTLIERFELNRSYDSFVIALKNNNFI